MQSIIQNGIAQPRYEREKQNKTVTYVPGHDDVALSQMSIFSSELAAAFDLDLSSYRRLHKFSTEHYRAFWLFFLRWSGVAYTGETQPICTSDYCETATFFPNLAINYTRNLLRPLPGAGEDSPAVTARSANGERKSLTRGALRRRVEQLGQALAAQGLGPGDRVVAILRNDIEAVVAALAVTAVGATFSSAAPEMGADAILARFAPLEPRFLIAHAAPFPQDTGVPVAIRVEQVMRGLPSLKLGIILDTGSLPDILGLRLVDLAELVRPPSPTSFEWQDFPFNHPLFIMFSSGTTGPPKCIVHGAGGTLLEHLKEHRLHCDLLPGDKVFFQTSCAWMMWNWQLSILASGAEIVLYDGPLSDAQTLWRIVADERVTVFGTSPAYLKMCEDAAIAPADEFELGSLRAILSTGSILHDAQYHWVRDHVGPVPLQSISGGTDILGCFVLGNPNLPIYAGESQCKGLGHDLRAMPPAGATSHDVGELVCANPFPSRPSRLFGDADGSRFHASYFAANPGMWTHGDLIEFTDEGGARLHGRSDGVLKVRGIRVGPAEIYRVLADCPEVREAVAVAQHMPAEFGADRVVLLLVLKQGLRLDGQLTARLRRQLTERASAAHVPDVFLQVDGLPTTYSGKQSEAAASDVVNGRPVRNLSALCNPECLDVLGNHPGLRPVAGAQLPESVTPSSMERELQLMWEALFAYAPIAWQDDFFELGGTSLLAIRLLAKIRNRMGRDLPLTTLHAAPTIEALAAVIRDKTLLPSARMVLLHPGEGEALFFIHSVIGTVTQLWGLGHAMRCRGPVYAIQARGLNPGEEAQQRVEDMAAEYIDLIRLVQPQGPYRLAGFSFGGLVAFEMAQQLARTDEKVVFLGMVDTFVHERFLPGLQWLRHRVKRPVGVVQRVVAVPRGQRLTYVADKSVALLDLVRVRMGHAPKRPDLIGNILDDADLPLNLRRTRGGAYLAMWCYRPRPYPGKVTFFRAAIGGDFDPLPIWRKVAQGGVDVHVVPGEHADMVTQPNVGVLATLLDRCLDAL